MNILFVCSLNQNRSKTAEVLFKDKCNVKSAGVLANFVTQELMEWADLIFVMEEWHRKELGEKFPKLCLKKRIICLDIPDMYNYMNPELVRLLKEKTKDYLEGFESVVN